MLRMLGGAAQLAATVDQWTQREIQQLQGEGAHEARTVLPEVVTQIGEGQFDHLIADDGSIDHESLNAWLSERTDGAPRARAEAFQRVLEPTVRDQLQRRYLARQQEAKAAIDDADRWGMWDAEDVNAARAIFTGNRETNPDRSEAEALEALVSPLLRSAAATGDKERFDRFAELMGDRFPDFVAEQRSRLEANVRAGEARQREENFAARQNELASMLDTEHPNFDAALESIDTWNELTEAQRLATKDRVRDRQRQYKTRREQEVIEAFRNDVATMHIDGQSPDTIISGILQWRDQVPERMIDQQLRDSRLQMQADIDRQFLQEQTEAIVEQARSVAMEGDDTGGLAMWPEELTITLPSGRSETLSRRQIAEMARDAEWQRINQQLPIDTPEAMEANLMNNLRARLDWLRQNRGLGLRDPALSSLLSGALDAVPEDATEQNIPPHLLRAFSIYRETGVSHSRQRDLHLSETDRGFFDFADFIHKNKPDTTEAGALLHAASALRSDRITREIALGGPSARELDAEMKGIARSLWPWVQNAKNEEYVLAQLALRARMYVALSNGGNRSAALEQAAADFQRDHDNVNGFFTLSAGREVFGEDLDAVGQVLVDYYVHHLEDEDREAFTLVSDPRSHLWRVSFRDSGIPAPDSPALTDADLLMIADELKGMDHWKRSLEIREQFRQDREQRKQRLKDRLKPGAPPTWLSSEQRQRLEREISGLRQSLAILDQIEPPIQPDPEEVEGPEHLRDLLRFVRQRPQQEEEARRREDEQRRERVRRQREASPARGPGRHGTAF